MSRQNSRDASVVALSPTCMPRDHFASVHLTKSAPRGRGQNRPRVVTEAESLTSRVSHSTRTTLLPLNHQQTKNLLVSYSPKKPGFF